jgi:hypothetical protein
MYLTKKMKNIKKYSLAALVGATLLSSCKKESVSVNNPSSSVSSFTAISTNSSFNWANQKKLTFTFTGSPSNGYNSLLKITSPDGNVVFQKVQKGDQNFSTTVILPTNYSTLNLSFGSIQKVCYLQQSNQINFNLN